MASATDHRPVAVAGATSAIAPYLLRRLLAAGHHVHALSRRPRPPNAPAAVSWHVVDITRDDAPVAPWGLVHLAPLWLCPDLVARLVPRGLRRVVAFGSTSRTTKKASPDAAEREIAERLARAEEEVERACAAHGVGWTILRPTLIYGGGRDEGLAAIAAFAARFRFFPVTAGGRGLRQPVHADDLALAATAALARADPANRAYDLSGGSTLTYREMVAAIFRGLGLQPRVIDVPIALYRPCLRVLARFGRWSYLSPAAADRMGEDLCFDHAAAARDLGFRPRPFSYPDPAPPPRAS